MADCRVKHLLGVLESSAIPAASCSHRDVGDGWEGIMSGEEVRGRSASHGNSSSATASWRSAAVWTARTNPQHGVDASQRRERRQRDVSF